MKPPKIVLSFGLAVLLGTEAQTQTIIDNFGDLSNWGTLFAESGKNLAVASGRMNFTSSTTAGGGGGIARNTPLLTTTQNWSIKVDVRVDPFVITNEDHGVSVFLGVGRTSDWLGTHVILGFDRDWWDQGFYGVNDDVQVNGVSVPGFFNVNLLPSADATLRLDFNAANQTITYYCDVDGPAGGSGWTMLGTTNITSGFYNLQLAPADTLSVLLVGWSEGHVVTNGQAYFDNLEIAVTSIGYAPDSIAGYTVAGAITNINGTPIPLASATNYYNLKTFSQIGPNADNTYSGNYTYVKTGTNTGTIFVYKTEPPEQVGETTTNYLVFTGPLTGTFTHLYDFVDTPPTAQYGTFQVVQTNAFFGSLLVTMSPTNAVSAGAQWQVDGGAWQNHSNVVNELSAGSHTVSYKPISGWNTPSNQTVVVAAGVTSLTNGIYTPQTGSLQVTITPAGAVAAGAQWQVDGGEWQNSGNTANGLTTGSHTIAYKVIPNWTAPGSQTVAITASTTTITNGTYENSTNTVSPPLAAFYGAVTAGGYHTATVRPDRTLWAWGRNDYGQIGDGTVSGKLTPVRITTANDWHSVAAGAHHTVALKLDGTLWAWGYNAYGQVGDGTTTGRWTPVMVGSATNWQAISAGNYYTLALKTDGTLWGWGHNAQGALGDGTTTGRLSPIKIGSNGFWRGVSGGDQHTLAIKSDGTLWSWGYNAYGQLGDGTLARRLNPVQIGNATNWQAIVAGDSHSLGSRIDGTHWAWGDNGFGQLGDGTIANRAFPVPIGVSLTGGQFTGGYSHSAAIGINRIPSSWGRNQYGQLGDGTTIGKLFPVQISSLSDVQSVEAGFWHTVALKNDGTLLVWGDNTYGQIGDGTIIQRANPQSANVPSAPAFVVSPTNQTLVLDATIQLKALAIGSQPIIYQWWKNATNLVNSGRVSGATTTNLTIANVQATDAGIYSVVVSNVFGSVTSSAARLTIQALPLLIISTTNGFGVSNGIFGFTLSGSPGQTVVMEASTNLSIWVPLTTNILVGDGVYFNDPEWMNYSRRYFRIRSW